MSDSILDGPYQPPLPLDLGGPITPAPSDEHAARVPVFTGAAVAKRDPERYRLFCALFFESGLGQMEVCKLLSMSPQTGAAIIAREQASMSAVQLRATQAARARTVVSLSLSAMQERLTDPESLKEIPFRDLAHGMQRAHDVGALLGGDATSRVDRTDGGARAGADAAAADYLASLPAADCRAEPIPAAENDEPREADGDGGQASADGHGSESESGRRDLQSPSARAEKPCKSTIYDGIGNGSYADSYADEGASGADEGAGEDGKEAR